MLFEPSNVLLQFAGAVLQECAPARVRRIGRPSAEIALALVLPDFERLVDAGRGCSLSWRSSRWPSASFSTSSDTAGGVNPKSNEVVITPSFGESPD
jgi:hypothetical protein